MRRAGIGGFEINPIAFPEWLGPVRYKTLTLFEEERLEMLQVTIQGAKESLTAFFLELPRITLSFINHHGNILLLVA